MESSDIFHEDIHDRDQRRLRMDWRENPLTRFRLENGVKTACACVAAYLVLIMMMMMLHLLLLLSVCLLM